MIVFSATNYLSVAFLYVSSGNIGKTSDVFRWLHIKWQKWTVIGYADVLFLPGSAYCFSKQHMVTI